MVKINQAAFADQISAYIKNTATFDEKKVEATLNLPFTETLKLNNGETFTRDVHQGIRFGHNTQLVMDLLAQAYRALRVKSNAVVYSQVIANAIQRFAEAFPSGDNLCYPHFLLHGIKRPTLDEIVQKIDENSRIIYETTTVRQDIIKKQAQMNIGYGLKIAYDFGHTDDYFGIASILVKEDEKYFSSTSRYISKVSFLIDDTNKELYVITIQGRRPSDRCDKNHKPIKDKQKGREYARITGRLGMDPRAFLLSKLAEWSKEHGFKKIKVIKPEYHPMFIEKHEGFLGKYEPVIKQAGVTQENGCYLEASL